MSAAVTSPAPGLAQVHRDRLVVLGGDDEALEVEDDLGDVLLDALDGRELVEHVVDLDAGDRGTRDGARAGYGGASCRACSRSRAPAAR